jgi:hypothetical protein
MSFVAPSTVSGFMWLAEPRSSPAPHFDGQRSLSAGGFQVWAPAMGDASIKTAAEAAIAAAVVFMVSSDQ